MPFTDFKLKSVDYKLRDKYHHLSGIQFQFQNGIRSPLFEAEGASESTLQTININTADEIRYVSMQIHSGVAYTGLRLYDRQ